MSKRSLAVVLGVLMLVSCLVVGDITIANAWTTGDGGKVHISFDNGSNWEDKYINSSGYADFEISQDCNNVKFKCVAEGTWYGYKNGSPSNGDGTYNDSYYASSSGGDIAISLKAGKYVVKYVNRHDSNATLEFNLFRKKAMIDYGWDSGSWNSYEMSYNGDGAYKYTITGNGQQLRFRNRYVDGSSETKYYPSSTDNIRDNTNYDTGYSASTGTSDNYWYIDTQNGASYTVWLKDGKVWITISGEGTYYYLTGWLNGASATGNTYAFTNTSGNTWTYAFSPTSGTNQYMTIKKSDGTVYHPASHKSGSGTAGTNTDTVADGDNKWMVTATSGQTVNLTWDSSTHVLSWTVSGGGGGGSSGSWKATKDHTDATPEFSGSAGNYRFVWANNDNGPGKSGTTAIVPKNSGNGYWADITSYAKSNSNFYFALSDNSSNSGIKGNKNEEIDDVKIAKGNTVTMTNSSGATIFYVEMKERGEVSGSAYYQLVRGVDWTKISAIGVQAYTNNDGHVDYKYFYKEVSSGGGGEEVSKVDVYAKDGAAPINWEDKGSGGASNTSGTAYNFAAIATTNITKINNATPSSGVVTTASCGDSSSQYQTASVDVGSTLTVTTTIASSWWSKYYIKGWCINGVTYKCNGTVGVNAASDTNTSTGVCTLTYTIPSEMSVDYLEITPIYYLRTNTNCITFYLEGYNTVQDKWGNTPYIYPFYGNLNDVSNSFGVYPGQPMVYADGKYSTEIPLKDNPINGSSTNTAIKGITINNGYADHVHRNMVYKWTAHDNDADHKQTYDYDDFYKIYEECLKNGNHPNSIIFRIQDETKTYNRYTYGGTKSGARVVATKSTLSSTDLSNINSNNGWELLTNRYGEPIDLFGTVVSEPATAATVINDNALRVISTGYNANIAGDYGTAWKVYKYTNSTTFSLIQDSTNDRYAAPPSIFLLRGSASGYSTSISYPAANRSVDGVGSYTDDINKYVGIYKSAKSYAGKPVYISYEKDAQDTRDNASGTGAYRLDGRWYYTHTDDLAQSTIGIEYWDNATGKWVTDSVTASNGTGSHTGCTASFDSGSRASNSNITTSSQVTLASNTTWNFTAAQAGNWLFDSWQIKYSDTSYDEMVGAGASSSIKATASYQLVARFVPTVSGSLTITHKLSGSSTGEGTVGLTAVVGSTTYNGTVDDNGVARVFIGTGISNANASTNITVTLTTTPQYDGTVTAFGYDKFNTDKSITASIKNGSGNTSTLPGGDNEVRKSVFSFTVGQLFAGTTLETDTLAYTSTIIETLHKYNFTYNFTDRGGASKSYTSKGMISQKDYKAYVTNQANHTLDSSFVTAKAPFESNFLKSNSLTPGTISYASGTHTFSATSSFTQTVSNPIQHVVFKLPYDYYTSSSGTSYKKYNASNASNNNSYKASKATFDLAANYNTFVTIGASSTTPGGQTKVSKVTDATDVNHTGNDFITAPDELKLNGNKKYFKYWEISRLVDETDKGTAFTKLYYPDFHYRIYGDYYVEAVYGDNPADSWRMQYSENEDNKAASIMYIGSSRNQWNSSSAGTTDAQATASDIIYNDFIFNFADKGAELQGSSNKIGMILERVSTTETPSKTWAVGKANVSDMNSYKTTYGSTEADRSSRILTWLSSSGTAPTGCVKIEYSTNDLNNKNFMEKCYSAYSAYGQTVDADNGGAISFKNDNTMDDYVYRAYAYMKCSDGSYVLSEPVYFCMKYTSSKKQFESE